MYLSEKLKESSQEAGLGQVDTVSLGGSSPTVSEANAQYGAKLFGPGGMCWMPKRGQAVLVIKAGMLGEESCMIGAETEASEDLEPGELRLYAQGCALELKNDGSVHITGNVYVNGKELGV